MIDPATLSVRALNYWRKQHIPTYLGLRYFLNNSEEASLSEWLLDFIEKKLATRQSERHYPYRRLKSKKNDKRNYRKFKALSPTTALIETYVMYRLSQIPEFEPRDSVYSRKWPSSKKTGRIFEYYLEGYKQRISDINEALEKKENSLVFICDIEDFYNSVSPNIALSKFNELLTKSSFEKRRREEILMFTERIIDPETSGIPIGPAISHLLSKMVLYDFDNEMENKYPGNYFRYVDDMAIVVDEDENKVKRIVEQQLSKLGLELNASKTEKLSEREWLSNQNDFTTKKGPQTFYGLLNRIRAFSYTNKDRRNEITELFKKKGYTFPLTRIFSRESNKRWYLNYLKDSFFRRKITNESLASEHLTFQTIRRDSPEKILETAQRLESEFKNEVLELIEEEIPRNGMKRKFQIQKIKHNLYKLFYFYEPSEYDEFLEIFIPDEKEFAQIRLVASSLYNRRADELLYLPGIPVLIFASIWTDQEMGMLELNWKELDISEKAVRESIAILTLYGVINPPEKFHDYLNNEGFTPDLNTAIRANNRVLKDLSYLDEFSSLGLGKTAEEREDFLKTRFDDRERFGMDALALDFSTSPSPA